MVKPGSLNLGKDRMRGHRGSLAAISGHRPDWRMDHEPLGAVPAMPGRREQPVRNVKRACVEGTGTCRGISGFSCPAPTRREGSRTAGQPLTCRCTPHLQVHTARLAKISNSPFWPVIEADVADPLKLPDAASRPTGVRARGANKVHPRDRLATRPTWVPQC